MTDIAALAKLVQSFEDALRVAKERLHKAQCDAVGIAIDDIVIGTGRRHAGKRFKVCKIEPICSKPWVSGYPERVAGGWSTQVRNLFDNWTKESTT